MRLKLPKLIAFLLPMALGSLLLPLPAGAEAPSAGVAQPAADAIATAQVEPDRSVPKRSGQARTRLKLQVRGAGSGTSEIFSPVRAVGAIAPYREGQRVEVFFFRNGEAVRRKVVPVTRTSHKVGVFQAVVRPDRAGRWAAGAQVRPNSRQTGARTDRRAWRLSYPSLRAGQCGLVVVGFKRALNRMGYIVNGGRCLGKRTERGILAYRKVNGLAQNRQASARLVGDVFRGRGGYRVRYPNTPGTHMEVPLSKQVLVFARGDRPVAIYPVSTGKPSTPTVKGSYQMDWTQPGFNNLDMYYSWYFYRGYAIHGYKSVPNYPASGGCIRTFNADQPEIFNRISKGDWIHIW